MDEKFDLSLRSVHRRSPVIYPTPHVDLQEYKSTKLATLKFVNKEYLDAICLSWVMIRTEFNLTISAYIIAYCYEHGIVLNKNKTIAINFYSLSAQKGLYMSNLRLAQIYNSYAVEYPQNKKMYYNMSYVFYRDSYKHKEASFYDKIMIACVLAKIRFIMYISRIYIDETELMIMKPTDIRQILIHQCDDLDARMNKYIKSRTQKK